MSGRGGGRWQGGEEMIWRGEVWCIWAYWECVGGFVLGVGGKMGWDTYIGERANVSSIRSAVCNRLGICNLHLHYLSRTLL
jgi:hypothetical protein